MFRTVDGSKNWKPIFKTRYAYDYSKAPYTKVPLLHWMFDIEIDPVDAEDAMFTTGLGGWETFNLSAVERWYLLNIVSCLPLSNKPFLSTFMLPKKGRA